MQNSLVGTSWDGGLGGGGGVEEGLPSAAGGSVY
jgi:hypothetical protein